ncbi:MAG TPA: helix-turn-helix transcriptional regulator [Thermomicrobiales bacterium]|jgi:transcriptional regulator with XRE-family HTH domain|nr:helix-turn-helix transcriptional regulator [Thermomicrobiales bacterium]
MPHQPAVRQRVGPTIKALRLRKELSLHQLAETAGVSPSHLSRIERGLTVPSYEVLDRIADSLGSDLRQLRHEEERARAVDGELEQLFDYFDMPGPTRAELLHLSNRARADIARALHRAIRRTA